MSTLNDTPIEARVTSEFPFVEGATSAVTLVATLEKLNERIKQMNRQLREIARQHSGVKLLCSITGLGPVLVIAIYAEIGDLSSFAITAKLRAYALPG